MIAFGEVHAHLPSDMLKGANNGRVAGGGAPHHRRNCGRVKSFPQTLSKKGLWG